MQDLDVLLNVIDRVHGDSASIHVVDAEIRTAEGLLEKVRLLSAGHVAFAYETERDSRVGLMLASATDASGYRWSEKLAEDVVRRVRSAIQALQSGKTGLVSVPMDISGRLRVDMALYRETLLERLYAGGPVMYPLIGVAMLALLLIIERVWWLYLYNADKPLLIQRVFASCKADQYEEAGQMLDKTRGTVSKTLAACLQHREQGVQAMEDGIQEQLLHELPRLRRFLAGLGILAAVAPLLGLLGTVTGIIETFSVIRAFGNTDPGLMAAGISEALITTATGLIIAIPIILFRGMLCGRMEKIIDKAESRAATLLNMLSFKRGEA